MIKTINNIFIVTIIAFAIFVIFPFTYGFAYFDNTNLSSQNKQVTIGNWETQSIEDVLNFTLVNNTYYSVSLNPENSSETVVIPETYNGLPVSEVIDLFLDQDNTVTELIIYAEIPSLEMRQFSGALALETMSFYYEVVSFGNQSFRDTPSAVDLYLYGNVSVVPITHNLTFRDSSLQNVHVPANMVSLFQSDPGFSSFNIIAID